jgi:hypothetical protein
MRARSGDDEAAGEFIDAMLDMAQAVLASGVDEFEPQGKAERVALRMAVVWRETGGDVAAVGAALRDGAERYLGGGW